MIPNHLSQFIIRSRLSEVILLVLLTSLPALPQTQGPTATSSHTPSPALGVIRGKVVNEAGQPLPNTSVVVAGFASMRGEQSVVTDREGKFEITGLEFKSYRLSPRLPAYVPLLRGEDPPEQSRYHVGDTVTLVLVKGGVITGTVTNQAGEPVVGVRVRARMVRDAERLPLIYWLTAFERVTDDRGVYRIYGLPEGTYVVLAGGAAQQTNEGDGYETDMPTYAPNSTRDTAQEIAVRSGVENSNVDIRYRDEPGRVISGRVLLPDNAESMRSTVSLTMANDGGGSWYTNSTQPANGKGFVFRGLADGDYDLRAVSAQANGLALSSPPKRIKVNGADVTGIELLPQPLSSISGKVVLQELKVPECTDKQRPVLSETFVTVTGKSEALNRQWRPYWPLGLQANVDSEGNLLLQNLLSGQYSFAPQFSAQPWYLESITLPSATANTKAARPVDASRSWTTLKPGERLSGLTITLAQGAASLQGTVAAREGEKLADGLAVYLVPAEREKADEVLRFFSATVRDGKVVLNNIAPGRYWVLLKSDAPALSKVRLPDQVELRSKLRHEAEMAKTEIEFKPCQKVVDFRF